MCYFVASVDMQADILGELCEALVALESPGRMKNFLRDLCTPGEIQAMAERWRVCQLLNGGHTSYREIYRLTGTSPATIGRVARFLRKETNGGYVTALENLKKNIERKKRP
jgi:TrpR-related protein YerC/YecD